MVTAVITTCKREPAIVLRALNSILNQTYYDIQIIVVDDSPADYYYRTVVEKTILDLNDQRIEYYKNVESKGACFARNIGLSKAKGEYIAFLDDDDEWIDTKIEKMMSVFDNSDRSTGLVYSFFYYYNDDTGEKWLPEDFFVKYKEGFIYDSLIFENYIGSTSFPLIRTSALNAIHGFDELLLSCQDYDVWLRLSKQFQVKYVKEPLSIYHVHNNDSISKNTNKRLQGQLRLYDKNIDYLSFHKEANASRLTRIAFLYAEQKNMKLSFRTYIKIISLFPTRIFKNTRLFISIIKQGLL